MKTPWTWKPPGRGWRTAIANTSWWRPVDATYFEAYVAIRPSELWHVILPIATGHHVKPPHRRFGFFGERGWPMWSDSWLYALHDKPHRIATMQRQGEVLSREAEPETLTRARDRHEGLRNRWIEVHTRLGKPWRYRKRPS